MSFASSLIGAGIGGVTKGIGSIIAGNSQADAYRDAANQANQTLTNTNNQIRTDYTPYTSLGSNAAGKLNNYINNTPQFTMADFYNDPGYQFTLQQGQNAVNNSAAARGGLLSGGAAKGLASYNTGLANQTYGDAYNRYMQNRQQTFNELSGTTGLGMNATNAVSNAGLQTGMQKAQNTFSALTGAGNAQAAGVYGLTSGLGNAAQNTLGQYYAQTRDPYGDIVHNNIRNYGYSDLSL
jgi:hypothetical protein